LKVHEFAGAENRWYLSLWLLVFFVVSLFLTGCAGPPKHPTWRNATGGEQHEQLMWKAISSNDWNKVERHISATFIGVSADGQALDRAAWVAYWKSAQPREISLGDISVQPEGPDMKVSGTLHIAGTSANGLASAAGFRVISIWQDIKGHWTLTATSLTPIQAR
jgi:Domain of unknown function (DUF4440)